MQPYDEYPTLDIYFGAYLHQDWTDEFEDPWEAFDVVLRLLDEPDIKRMIDELSRLIDVDEPQLDELMRILCRYLNPRRFFGTTDRQWLQSLRDRAAAELAGRSASGG